MPEKRNRLEIVFDLLRAVQQKGGVIKPTHLLYKSNLSYNRMKGYIENLKQKGLIDERTAEGKTLFAITDDGLRFLAEYKKIRDFSEAFGL